MNYDDYFAQGVALQNQGRWAEAAAIYGELARTLTQVPAVHWNLGTVNKHLGRWDAALAAFQTAAALDRTQPGTEFNIGLCLLRLGRTEEAVIRFTRGTEAEPDDAPTRHNLARALAALGRTAEATPHAEAAVALRPDFAEAALLRSRLRALQPMAGLPPLLNDRRRAGAMATAITAQVGGGDIVLDLAANGGQSALLALRAGAARVYSWSEDAALAQTVAAIAAANDLGHRLTVLSGPLAAVTVGGALAQAATVLVADLPAPHPQGAGLLPLLRDAQARLLVPGARILPRRIRVLARLAGGSALEALFPPDEIAGYDLSALAATQPGPVALDTSRTAWAHEALSDTVPVHDIALAAPPASAVISRRLEITATRNGRLAGLLQWQEIDWGAADVPSGAGGSWDNDPVHTAGVPVVFHRCRHPTDILAAEEVAVHLHQSDHDLWLAPQR